jgi:hypothetical protein
VIGLQPRIKLDNHLLGDSCFISSSAEPLQIDFTTRPSGQLNGTPGHATFNHEYTYGAIKGGHLINAKFAAPRRNRLRRNPLLLPDPLVNSILGLPSPSGENRRGRAQSPRISAVQPR